MDEVTYQIKVDVPSNTTKPKDEVLDEIGQYLVDSILDYVGEGKSPVSGYPSFKKLSAEYAKNMKAGDDNPNLDLTGSMLDSLGFRVSGDTINIGIFGGSADKTKAFAHNTGFEGHPVLESKSLIRRFIPDDESGEVFKKDILSGVDRILDEHSMMGDKDEDKSVEETSSDLATSALLLGMGLSIIPPKSKKNKNSNKGTKKLDDSTPWWDEEDAN
jgi:hypothetical protein